MIVRRTSTWLRGRQGMRGRADHGPFKSMSQPADDVPGFELASPEHDDERYLMTVAESMLRAGYGHKEIERALRRMSPQGGGRRFVVGAVRALTRARRSTPPAAANNAARSSRATGDA